MTWLEEVRDRLTPVGHTVTLPSYVVLSALLVAAAVVGIRPIWRWFRLVVTLVHELGHAGVGVLTGRRFTGFVVGEDGSGHAVTAGPRRGPGRIVTTWSGYPMPALVGALLVWAAWHGWSAPLLGATLVGLALVVIRIRSVLTLIVLVATAVSAGWLWWSATERTQATVLLTVGVLLVVGAWRHLFAVWSAGRSIDDPQVLAGLTRIPAPVWLLSWALVCALATWPVVTTLGAALR